MRLEEERAEQNALTCAMSPAYKGPESGMVEEAYFKETHYNMKYKGGAILNGITAEDLRRIRPSDIAWLWHQARESLGHHRAANSREGECRGGGASS
jgi:hypothetical protein